MNELIKSMSMRIPKQLEIACFMYHEVTDDPDSSGFIKAVEYKHGKEHFASDMRAIAEHLPHAELVDSVDFNQPGRHLLLTFDDGGKSAMIAADILETFGWKGHFFVTTRFIDQVCFLTKMDIVELHRRGHHIGSHSHSHPEVFYNLRLKQMREEWKRSIGILEQLIGSKVNSASIPGGEMDKRAIISADQCDVRFLFTSEQCYRPWQLGNTICFGRLFPKISTPRSSIAEYAQFKGVAKPWLTRAVKKLVKRVVFTFYDPPLEDR